MNPAQPQPQYFTKRGQDIESSFSQRASPLSQSALGNLFFRPISYSNLALATTQPPALFFPKSQSLSVSIRESQRPPLRRRPDAISYSAQTSVPA
ncbi:hypothetical protein KFK09_024811 [Dendrobium nobile]|uniref:Uncharacterized protein n=1 Tax=Dendrobium nobile TaxID=94219 RepID=A0A8T3AEU1_DENNO|nr:hypothetical protein KFK09_024811 [Dendrobium nobile]